MDTTPDLRSADQFDENARNLYSRSRLLWPLGGILGLGPGLLMIESGNLNLAAFGIVVCLVGSLIGVFLADLVIAWMRIVALHAEQSAKLIRSKV